MINGYIVRNLSVRKKLIKIKSIITVIIIITNLAVRIRLTSKSCRKEVKGSLKNILGAFESAALQNMHDYFNSYAFERETVS